MHPNPAGTHQVLKCPLKSRPEENKEKEHLHYSNSVDSWAVGVLTYELLVGCPPFYDESKKNTEARIRSSMPAFPSTLSEGARDFIIEGEGGRGMPGGTSEVLVGTLMHGVLCVTPNLVLWSTPCLHLNKSRTCMPGHWSM